MEFWDVCDSAGNPTGRRKIKGETFYDGEYHIAVEIWIVDSNGRFLIQKRSSTCLLYPGIWSLTAGRIQAGEDSFDGIIRETKEELGLDISRKELKHIARLNREDGSHMIWDVFLVRRDIKEEELFPDEQEVAEVKWVSGKEMEQMIREESIFVYPEMMDFMRRIDLGEV